MASQVSLVGKTKRSVVSGARRGCAYAEISADETGVFLESRSCVAVSGMSGGCTATAAFWSCGLASRSRLFRLGVELGPISGMLSVASHGVVWGVLGCEFKTAVSRGLGYLASLSR